MAAYNWTELPDMSPEERMLWQGLGYAYECYRAGEDSKLCKKLADGYVSTYLKQKGLNNDRN